MSMVYFILLPSDQMQLMVHGVYGCVRTHTVMNRDSFLPASIFTSNAANSMCRLRVCKKKQKQKQTNSDLHIVCFRLPFEIKFNVSIYIMIVYELSLLNKKTVHITSFRLIVATVVSIDYDRTETSHRGTLGLFFCLHLIFKDQMLQTNGVFKNHCQNHHHHIQVHCRFLDCV